MGDTDPSTEIDTLGTALPHEMARVRDNVMPQYLALRGMPNVNVEPALYLMRASLDAAAFRVACPAGITPPRCARPPMAIARGSSTSTAAARTGVTSPLRAS